MFVGAVAQPPTFKYDQQVDPVANRWTNYTWNVIKIKLDFGDGSAAVTNGTDNVAITGDEPTITSDHTYANGGIFVATLQVITGNFSATQTNSTPADPPLVPTGQPTETTTVGQTVAVGSYHPLTYSGNVIKPGIITNVEAVTGGYTSLDPALDYESTGFEVIANIYETLIAYNGTSTSDFVPVIADQIPTVANGRVSADFLNYTFHIRQGMKFSNGDTITPWDVKYSITRTMLFNSGSPFPNGWIISQFFVPPTFVSDLTTPSGCSLGDPGCSLDGPLTFSTVPTPRATARTTRASCRSPWTTRARRSGSIWSTPRPRCSSTKSSRIRSEVRSSIISGSRRPAPSSHGARRASLTMRSTATCRIMCRPGATGRLDPGRS